MNNSNKIGAKTLKLYDLKKSGLNVPNFEAIDSDELKKNIKNLESLAQKIDSNLNCEKYAVRSSALIEDSKKESFAGQFKTIINVDKKDLASAIKEITDHAKKFLGGSLEKFSILIQEYIEPDISGITFTRNPVGGREMIIEYHKGRGEEIVSGKIKPERIELYWNNSTPQNILPTLSEAFKNFQKIENFYKFPQDIEWCIKDNVWYFLQTRPITTVSENDHQQSLFLDETLPKTNFYFEKTEISEIAPRPTQITKNLLEKAYEKNGPIDQVYKKYKIDFQPKNILKIIGNELFVDREEELHTLLPSYSYLKSTDLKPKLSGLSGILKTIKNIFHLHGISLDNYSEIFQNLKTALEDKKEIKRIRNFLEIFEKNYRLVFEINLLAGISIKRLEILTKNEVGLSLLLSRGEQLLDKKNNFEISIDTGSFTGNTIEVSDESKFIRNISNQKNNNSILEWWGKLSAVKKNMLIKKIEHAVIYNRLREMSRWLVVKRINQLREILFAIAEKNKFNEKRNIYFADIKEISEASAQRERERGEQSGSASCEPTRAYKESISENICKKRKEKYEKYSKFNMPKILTFKPIIRKQKTQGISPGKTEGILLEVSDFEKEKFKNSPKILYTKVLSPDLVTYFEKINGIVSEQGGFLSHLAIIARERGIPVITNFEFGSIQTGEKIKINGETGEILSFTSETIK